LQAARFSSLSIFLLPAVDSQTKNKLTHAVIVYPSCLYTACKYATYGNQSRIAQWLSLLCPKSNQSHAAKAFHWSVIVMLRLDDMNILFYSEPIDMRKSINTLCVLIVEVLNKNPVDGSLFLFRNRSGNKLKALYYETNCFTIWYRRLEKGKYVFQRDAKGSIPMSKEHLSWLLASDKYSRRDAALPVEASHFY
jgi:transposase